MERGAEGVVLSLLRSASESSSPSTGSSSSSEKLKACLRLALEVGVLSTGSFLGVAFGVAEGLGVPLALGVLVPPPADFLSAPMCSVMALAVGW